MEAKMKVLVLFLIVFGLVVFGHGADYYVSKSGNDSNPGTEAQPWKTIQKAANTLTAGDTVYIKAGSYYERVQPQKSGSAGNYITYTAYPGDTVIIDGSGISLPYDWGGLFDISNRSYIKVSGLQIKNAGPNDNNCGILVDYGNYITLENNYTYNTTSSGIGVWDSSNITLDGNEVELACNDGEQECISVAVTDTFVVKNNHVHNGGPGSIGAEGICLKDGSRNGKAYNNRVHDMNRLGIYLDAWDKHTYNIEVYSNIVYDINGNDGITLASESGGLLENITIYNNIVYNADENGIAITRNGDSATHPMKNITIINNTFYNNGSPDWGGGIGVDNPNLQSAVIRNNIVSQNVFYSIIVEPDSPMGNITIDHNLIHGFRDYDDETRGSNYVEGDPLFVNASAANFHLQSNSPAIDAGSSSSAPGSDYDGNTRPSGSGYDIGAFEYGASGGSGPVISLNPYTLDVTALIGSTGPFTRTFSISNSGTGTLDWSVTDNAAWLSVSPAGGSGSATVTATIDTSGLSAGSYSGTVTVSSTTASNSPQTVTVNLTVTAASGEEEPFGSFDTPLDGSTVRSSFAVTGWALDDVAVASVKIYRDPVSGEGGNQIYIGDTNFVEGARPDVEQLFPGYPNNSRAGWGYMLLSNFLPNGGNGTFKLYAVAADSSGNTVTLGSKTILCDNINAVKPFGAIDTPTQGGTASGSSFVNWGWVLTPQPNKIPTDGSTIDVWVDGVKIGHPAYNIYRPDIASLFPSYANSNGAVGYFYLDTTAYADGVHTIQWTAADNGGNSDGIGSRYFTIQNNGPRGTGSMVKRFDGLEVGEDRPASIPVDNVTPVKVMKGYRQDRQPETVYPAGSGIIVITIKELERLEIRFISTPLKEDRLTIEPFNHQTYPLSTLPIGSTLDRQRGVFYWQPGPGFIGTYRFDFAVSRGIKGKTFTRRQVVVRIVPRGGA
jgi:parallel beta-helix repeat protein